VYDLPAGDGYNCKDTSFRTALSGAEAGRCRCNGGIAAKEGEGADSGTVAVVVSAEYTITYAAAGG